MIKGWWWKFPGFFLLVYVIVKGIAGPVPELPILDQSIRNLYFHVPMWFAMMFIMFMSLVFSIAYLWNNDRTGGGSSSAIESVLGKQRFDILAAQWARVGFLYGILGIITGSIWARVTWGEWWVFQEVKLNAAAAGILIYAAYFILRGSVDDEDRRARLAAVYNIFAFVMFIVLINVIPRVAEGSLHPGNAGNPGFSSYDLDNKLRWVFYPAVLGWTLLAGWMIDLSVRLEILEKKKLLES
jgi:heme exporter protein C